MLLACIPVCLDMHQYAIKNYSQPEAGCATQAVLCWHRSKVVLAVEMDADVVDVGMAAETAHGSCTDVPPARK
jgi:hypothetical protein